jgi:hypothetical protein
VREALRPLVDDALALQRDQLVGVSRAAVPSQALGRNQALLVVPAASVLARIVHREASVTPGAQ